MFLYTSDYFYFVGLRRRIATLFLQYCKTPLFNAEAAKHIKMTDTHIINVCMGCVLYTVYTGLETCTVLSLFT